MSTIAKFVVNSITRTLGTVWDASGKMTEKETQTIVLYPVTGGSSENKSFFANTPCGKIELGIVNADAAAIFELNKEYIVTFEKAHAEPFYPLR